jgi:hypothetical protein
MLSEDEGDETRTWNLEEKLKSNSPHRFKFLINLEAKGVAFI